MVSSLIITCSEAWLCRQHPREGWGNQSVTAPSTGEKGSEVIVSAAKPAGAQCCVCISCSCLYNDLETQKWEISWYMHTFMHWNYLNVTIIIVYRNICYSDLMSRSLKDNIKSAYPFWKSFSLSRTQLPIKDIAGWTPTMYLISFSTQLKIWV